MSLKFNQAETQTISNYRISLQMIEGKLQSYLQGCLDSRELKGKYNTDFEKMEFVKMEESEVKNIPELKVLQKD